MGDGKITLMCLENCDAIFDLTCLQKALKPDVFSKWFRKIQMAEIGEVSWSEYCIPTIVHIYENFRKSRSFISLPVFDPYAITYILGGTTRSRRMSILSIYNNYGYYARRK